MEWIDIYDKNRVRTGQVRKRGASRKSGEYGLVVCVWVYDGYGHLLLTKRAKGKSFAGTWENSGGAAQAGEDSLTAIVRELREETGICAPPEQFELIDTSRDHMNFYDHYCLQCNIPVEQIRLLPGETDDAMWVTFEQMHELIAQRKVCSVISQQFLHAEKILKQRQFAQ